MDFVKELKDAMDLHDNDLDVLTFLNKKITTTAYPRNKRRKRDKWNGDDAILLRIVVCVLLNGTNNVEDLTFAIDRGYFPTLINRHLIKTPFLFHKSVHNRQKFIKRLYSDEIPDSRWDDVDDIKNLKRVKKIYGATFERRKLDVEALMGSLSHLVCNDVSKFMGRFVGVH